VAAGTPYKPVKAEERFRLLVFGGSQGAQFFSTAIPAAVALLPEKDRARLLITQQSRKEDEAAVRDAYKKLGIPADVAPFFNDMPARMADAQFVISRSGASTVSEITVIGRPAMLVPFPHALDHDQAANAAALAAVGGGRSEAEAAVRDAYKKLGIPADVAPFFNDMPARMADAQFVISRSGASTVSEITVIGRPAMLVPFPHALDHDQAANAAALAAVGGGEVVRQSELSPERLAGILQAAMNEPQRLNAQAKAAKSVGKPDAARLLADLAEAIAAGKSVQEFKEGTRP